MLVLADKGKLEERHSLWMEGWRERYESNVAFLFVMMRKTCGSGDCAVCALCNVHTTCERNQLALILGYYKVGGGSREGFVFYSFEWQK